MKIPDVQVLYDYIRNEATEEQKIIVEKWLEHDASNREELLGLGRIYYADRTLQRMLTRDSATAFEAVNRKIRRKTLRRWGGRITAAAACVAGVVALSTVLPHRMGTPTHGEPQFVTVEANPGMRARLTLPDGSLAHLNSGSRLTYSLPFGGDVRRVSLNGEAFFRVTEDSDHPFVVSTLDERFKVKVLGTEFNVRAYEADGVIETTLVEGSVDVQIGVAGGETCEKRLNPAEKIVYDIGSNSVTTEKVNPIYDIDWTEGKLMFKDTPVEEVLRKLSHFYNVEFSVNDPAILEESLTGTFVNRHLYQVLDYIRISSGVEFRITPPTADESNSLTPTTITLWKKKK